MGVPMRKTGKKWKKVKKTGRTPEFYPKTKGTIFARAAKSEKFAALSMYSATVSENSAALFACSAGLICPDGVHSSAASCAKILSDNNDPE